jgi:hypothetical protein
VTARRPTRPHRLRLSAAGLVLGALWALGAGATAPGELPARLSDTGLFAPGTASEVRAGIAGFSPQYPLWSDAAEKRRWLRLPPGKAIDARHADAWVFPIGTQLWKEFAQNGRPVETRYIQRFADGSWRFAAYLWRADGRDADLAPAGGAMVSLPAGGLYAVPSRADCLACHGGAAVPVLGFSALQLSPDRDPLAVHGRPQQPGDIDLRGLAARGWLRRYRTALLANPPRIAAGSAVERAALGYLHANCGHCHNDSGNQAPVHLRLAQTVHDARASREAVLRSTAGAGSRYRPAGGAPAVPVVVPGNPQASLLALRMRSRQSQVQMPPLGTLLVDAEGLALVDRWILHLPALTPMKETSP